MWKKADINGVIYNAGMNRGSIVSLFIFSLKIHLLLMERA